MMVHALGVGPLAIFTMSQPEEKSQVAASPQEVTLPTASNNVVLTADGTPANTRIGADGTVVMLKTTHRSPFGKGAIVHGGKSFKKKRTYAPRGYYRRSYRRSYRRRY